MKFPRKAGIALLVLFAAGCRQDMHDAPRYEAYEANAFYADGRASRSAPTGTVARGWLRDDEALYTGKLAGQTVDEYPFPIGRAELQRGQEPVSYTHLTLPTICSV